MRRHAFDELPLSAARTVNARKFEPAPGMVSLGDLDPVDAEFILEALGKMPVSTQRLRIASWVSYAIARCTNEPRAIGEALREDTQ